MLLAAVGLVGCSPNQAKDLTACRIVDAGANAGFSALRFQKDYPGAKIEAKPMH